MKILFFGDSITDMCRNRDENADEILLTATDIPCWSPRRSLAKIR